MTIPWFEFELNTEKLGQKWPTLRIETVPLFEFELNTAKLDQWGYSDRNWIQEQTWKKSGNVFCV